MNRQNGRQPGITRGGKKWTPQYLERINPERCSGCGFCLKVCPMGVFQSSGLPIPTLNRLEECIGCRVCARMCKDRAIELEVLEGDE